MREARKTQHSLRENWIDLGHADELRTISRLLDDHPSIEELVLQDLRSASHSAQTTVGAGGLSAKQVVRMLIVKQGAYSQMRISHPVKFLLALRTSDNVTVLSKMLAACGVPQILPYAAGGWSFAAGRSGCQSRS
jgi:hypothetical protein